MGSNVPSRAKDPTEDELSGIVLMELECPVCAEYMIPPITLCESGHNICSRCKPNLNKCPSCRQQLLTVRNLTLERITSKIKYPCCNRQTGCDESFPLDQIILHERTCLHRVYECPLARAPGISCLWQGPWSHVKKHIDINHKGRVTEAVKKLSVYIRNFEPTYKYCRVIYALGQIFYQQFQVTGNNFYFVVQYVGPEDTACRYKYDFTLRSASGDQKIQVSQVTRSVKINVDEICQSGKCVKLHYDIVKNSLDENAMTFEMEISKIEDGHKSC
jgi:E3 ubiquitin-protein ligase SIAH1